MRLGDVQKAARPQEMRDDLGPSVDVGQPANRAPADEHDIEAGRLRDRRWRVVEIGEGEISPVGQTQLTGQSPGSGDRIRGKIQTDDIGAALREFQCVGTEMALQVQDTLAGNRTELGLLDRVEAAAPFAQGGQIVTARPEVDAHLFVPMGTVDRSPRRRIAHDRSSWLCTEHNSWSIPAAEYS